MAAEDDPTTADAAESTVDLAGRSNVADQRAGRSNAADQQSGRPHPRDRLSSPRTLSTAPLDRRIMQASIEAELFGEPERRFEIGRFVLLSRIGAGAIGEVYAAYDEQLDRKVAVKLLRPDRSRHDDMASARLLREAKTLAQVSHPNVVHVYEAGTHEGKVYLAMEFIRGTTLRQWVAEQAELPRRRRWRAILAKFTAAAQGLGAAHAAGLVHRDVKPDNVLVADDGRVRVADFGLARPEREPPVAIADDANHPAPPGDVPGSRPMALTATGAVLGTPAYMSPEQFRGQATDERSDQFSFCVALYEALYGKRPFVATGLDALRQTIESGELPTPPRDAGVPGWVWRALERGLAVDPRHRFANMDELVAALSRDVHQRRWTLGAALGIAALVAGTLTVQATAPDPDPCAQAGSTLAEIWNPAARERLRGVFAATGLPFAEDAFTRVATRIDRFTEGLAAERIDACEAAHVRHEQSARIFELRSLCLDDRRRHLDAFLAEFGRDAPAVEHSIAAAAELPRIDSCRDTGALESSFRPIQDDALRAEARQIEVALAEAGAQRLAGRHDEALRTARAQLARARSLGLAPLEARAASELGAIGLARGDAAAVADADRQLRVAAELAASARDSELEADVWLRRVLLATRHHGDMDRAETWATRAIAVSRRVADRGARLAEAMTYRGIVHYRAGDLDRAEHFQAVGLELAAAGGTDPLVVSNQWHWLANTLEAAGRLDDARAAYRRALTIHRAELGPEHPRVARLLHDMGTLLSKAGDHDEARTALESSLAKRIAIHGREHVNVADVHRALANLEQRAGQLDRAEAHARRSLVIYTDALDADDLRLASAANLLGVVQFRQRRYPASLASYERALAVQRRTLDPENLRLVFTRSNIAETLVQLGRYDQALAIADEIAPILQQLEQRRPALAAMVFKTRGMARLGKGDPAGAAQQLERALELFGDDPSFRLEIAAVQWALVRALERSPGRGRARDSRDRAVKLARAAAAIYTAQAPAGDDELAAITAWLRSAARGTHGPKR